MKTMARLLPILLTLLSLPLAGHKSQAVSPPPDGGYSGNNTAEGQNALLSLTTGVQEQETTIAQLKKQMGTVVAGLKEYDERIQKVSARIEVRKAVGQTVLNKP